MTIAILEYHDKNSPKLDYGSVYDQVEREYWNSKYNDDYFQQKDPPISNYYMVGGIEVIDYIKAKLTPEQYKGYLLGNIYKYSGRCQYKGDYIKDVEKLTTYTNWLKEINDNNF